MAHITRCPRCHTAFKVYPDQLRIASGRVRCGHCGCVFEALAHAIESAPGAAPAAPASHRSATAPVWPELFGEPLEKLHESPPVAPSALTVEPETPAAPRLEPADSPSPAPAERGPEFPGTAPGARAGGPRTDLGSATAGGPREPTIGAAAPSAALEAAWAPAPAKRASTHAGWAALAVLLALLLVAQGIFWQRDWIAARWPVAAPTLRLLCAPLQCTIAPYRQLSAIAIVDSKFKATAPDNGVYELELTLHNRATLTVGTPSLELTLTDNANRVLVRRALTPRELGTPPALAAGADVAVARRIQITTAGALGPVANYRLTAFYP